MKFVVLAIGIIGIVPLALVLRGNPAITRKFWVLFGMFPFLLSAVSHTDVALITWDDFWVGYVPALQISMLDLVAVAIYFSVKDNTNSINFHFPILLYLSAIFLSVFQAEMPLASIFYLWQFIRAYFIIFVIAKACSRGDDAHLGILNGMALGVALQVVIVVWQRFALHAIQPTGSFIHQNTLGLIMHLAVFPNFAMALIGQGGLLTMLTPLNGALVTVLIASRAALGFAAIGFMSTYIISVLSKWTYRKALFAGAAVLAIGIVAPMALTSFERRFNASPLLEDEYDERGAFNRAARLILEDHPMGVGANHYVFVAKNYGYSIRAGVLPFEGNLNNIVHNIYLLTAAETGYFGVISLAMLLLYSMWTAFRYGWKGRHSRNGALLLAFGISVLMVSIHSFFEYILITKECQYMLAIVLGMIFGVSHQVKAEHGAPRPPTEAESPQRGSEDRRKSKAGRLLHAPSRPG